MSGQEWKPGDGFTAKEVMQSVGWLDAMDDDIDWHEADWSDGASVRLEGRAEGLLVEATFTLTSWSAYPDYDDMGTDEDSTP